MVKSNFLARALKIFLLVTDIGFLVYWLVTLLHLIPPPLLFKDYADPVMIAWNWSFFPLDVLISLTGLSSLWMYQGDNALWRMFAVVSLTLTSVSGLMAVSFWTLLHDFNWVWWLPNLLLLFCPLIFLIAISVMEYKE